ncbi:dITP/XTP pyrophosphatase-like [Globicephala melas]|uniref:dITP/XTP pyrophosphatase-like n=1 Tax=Globicephala melas TaxID=9731 RepID=UPI00293D6746|nr:dITP/XTP pyrophosphatase-like [Globicephala melas]
MKKLVFATNNVHKLAELQAILGDSFELMNLKDINCFDDIEETADTLEGNALIKARYVYEKYGYSCFADDTGLEVEALGNAPGVHTARYAYNDRNDTEANISKLLTELEGIEGENRQAQFRTVIALIDERGGKTL